MPEGEPRDISAYLKNRPPEAEPSRGGEMQEAEKPNPYIRRTAEQEPQKTELRLLAENYRKRLIAALQNQLVETSRDLLAELQELENQVGREKWEKEVAPAIKGEIPSTDGVTLLSTKNNTQTFADAFVECLADANFHGANAMLENFARAVKIIEERKKSS